jgi:outer membrane protein
MRTFVLFMLAGAALAVASIPDASAQEPKIGYINSVRVFSEHEATVEAEEIYNREVGEWKAEAENMAKEIAQMREELKGQSLMLSDAKKEEKLLALDQKIQEYQQFMEDVFGEGGRAEQRNRELTEPILERINTILTRIGEEDNYTLILDVANATVLYAKKELDLTDRVLEELRATGP